MKLIVCLDDKNGMSFNGRRQSRDRVVTERICEIVEGNTLCGTEYSLSLFAGTGTAVRIVAEPDEVCADEYLFAESKHMIPAPGCVEQLFVFRWNRDYPSDLKFPVEEFKIDLTLKDSFEFAGYSHSKITLEVYIC